MLLLLALSCLVPLGLAEDVGCGSECLSGGPQDTSALLQAHRSQLARSGDSSCAEEDGERPHGCAKRKKPHILYILADDFGWANFGPHRDGPCRGDEACEQGQAEVNTPSMDHLVKHGLLLDRHYSYRICSPTRNSIQSGRLGVHVNWENLPVTILNRNDPISGFQGMPRNMTGMAQKMRDQGYRTHMVGKWDVGMATPEHTPQGRGYDSWLGYFTFANDFWRKDCRISATGQIDNCLNAFTDFSVLNDTYRGGVQDEKYLTHECSESREPDPPCYEEYAFKQRALQVIREHDASDKRHPLFLFYASHLVHTPLQVPLSYIDEIEDLVKKKGGKPFSSQNRKLYAAMVLYLDRAIGEMVDELKKQRMYDDTLILFHSDNGGPIYMPGSANNYPLRGGKYNDFEGGFRTNAFLSGGWLPLSLRGKKHDGVISVADWYGTFCVIGGGSERECLRDKAAEDANEWIEQHNAKLPSGEEPLPLLHGVDSVVQWPFILSGKNGRPEPLHLTDSAVLEWPFKLMVGKQRYGSGRYGPLFPNCSTVQSVREGNGPIYGKVDVFNQTLEVTDSHEELEHVEWYFDCGDRGCLFNVERDPTEHHDLADCPKHQDTLRRLQRKLKELQRDIFRPNRGEPVLLACEVSAKNGGYYGPFVDVGRDYYSELPEWNDTQTLKRIRAVHTPEGYEALIGGMEAAMPAFEVAANSQDDCIYNNMCP